MDTKYNMVQSQFQNILHQEKDLHLCSHEVTMESTERAITSPGLVSHVNDHCLLNMEDSYNSIALQSLKGHLDVAKGDLKKEDT
jgi:golgin subfamily B member 1